MKTLKDGADFEYPTSFGFSGSSVAPKQHPTQDQDEFGDGTYLARQAATPAMAKGGAMPPHPHQPTHAEAKTSKAVLGALQLGQAIGQKKAQMAAAGGQPPGGGAPALAMGAAPGAAPAITSGPMPAAMACGGPVPRMADGGGVEAEVTVQHGTKSRDGTMKMDSPPAIQKTETVPNEDFVDKAKGGFIKDAIKKPGELHRDLGVPQGEKIPAGKLEAAAHKPGKVGQRARFAETLKGLNHSKKG